MPTKLPIPEEPGIIKVTPELAENWLTHRNIGNRKTSRTIVDRYARAMAEGRWMVTPQGISFDRDGLLLDGQHRLTAVMVSGVPVEMFVAPGFDRATFSVLDSGYKRHASQIINVPHNTLVSSAARILGTVQGVIADKGAVGGVIARYADNDQIIDIIGDWPELVELSTLAKGCYSAAHIPASAHLAILAQASRTQYAHRIDSWGEGLRDGVGLDRTDPRLHLRNRFIRDANQFNATKSRVLAYRLIARAWNAHAAGLSMGVLRVRDDEETPQVLR